ncbi:hypothetical protein YC2023_084385 [Brassica napus]
MDEQHKKVLRREKDNSRELQGDLHMVKDQMKTKKNSRHSAQLEVNSISEQIDLLEDLKAEKEKLKTKLLLAEDELFNFSFLSPSSLHVFSLLHVHLRRGRSARPPETNFQVGAIRLANNGKSYRLYYEIDPLGLDGWDIPR